MKINFIIPLTLALFSSLLSASVEWDNSLLVDPFLLEDEQTILLRKVDKQNNDYSHNKYVPIEVWEHLEPYFLPIDHPVKRKLDRIFDKRVTQSKKSFESAGFAPIRERAPTNIIIGRHPKLEGYIIKAYLDTQPALCEWMNWCSRIEGARVIRESIRRNHFSHFKVPRKWIYPLPQDPSPPDDSLHNRKNFILIVEDMKILGSKENKKAFKEKITKEILDDLYTILSKEGLLDSVFCDNIPFNQSGYICFIDTEHFQTWPVKFEKLLGAFSPRMQRHWQSLITQGKVD